MCKKLVLLTLFLAILGLTSVSFAEDLEPPDWAGAEGWGATLCEFDVEPPAVTEYIYNPELEEPEVNVWIYGEGDGWCSGFEWDEGEEMIFADPEGAFSLYIPTPEGDGDTLTARVQITYWAEGGFEAMLELWDGPSRAEGYMGGICNNLDDYDYFADYEIEGGLRQMVIEGTTNNVQPYVNLLVETWDGAWEIYEVVLDVVIYSGDQPDGDGTRPGGPGGPVVTATNPRPGNGETEVNAVDVTVLVWDDPNATVIPDPNYDVWVNGSNTVVDSNNFPIALDWGTVYNWRVDVINEPAGDEIAGEEWTFSTGGIATLVSPDNEDWWIHYPVDLTWEGDMYAESYKVYLGEDPNLEIGNIVDGTAATEPNYVVSGLSPETEYFWKVEEVNSTLGGTIGESATWSFETYDPAGKPFDDWLGAGHTKDIEWSSNVDDNIEGLLSDEDLAIESMADMSLAEGVEGWYMETEFADVNAMYPRTGDVCDLPWLMLDLGHDYDLWLMWLWNCNGWTLDGISEYTVHYVDEAGAAAEDPNEWSWTQLGDIENLAQAPGEDGLENYAGAAGPTFEGTTARYVVISILSGLDAEVEFDILSRLKIELQPRLAAYGPTPGNHASDVPIDADLGWYAGLRAADTDGHDVYLGSELVDEKKIELTITWQSPNLVPQGESWGWEDEFWAEWGYEGDPCDNWQTTTIVFWTEANPIGEVITLLYEGIGQTELIYIDKMVIDTDCNPDFAGGQVHAEWTFDTNAVGEEDANAFADPYDFNDGISEEWFNFDWVEGGEWLADYDGLTGVWALDANEFAEMGFSLANFAQVDLPYVDTVSNPTYEPGILDLDTTYFWKIDEVNDPNVWEGKMWDFTTELCTYIDDFESGIIGTDNWYGHDQGIPDADNGGVISTEITEVYEGAKGLFFSYNCYYTSYPDVGYACAQGNFSSANLNASNAGTIGFAFKADGADTPLPGDTLYIELESGTTSGTWHTGTWHRETYPGNMHTATEWVVWEIALDAFGDAGVDCNDIDLIRIGATTESTDIDEEPIIYIDSINRCAPHCNVAWYSLPADISGPDGEPDCVVDMWDVAALTGAWLEEDEWVTPVAPSEANELVEYLFADLTDSSSGTPYNGILRGTGASVADGVLTLGAYGGYGSVEVGSDFNGLKLFDGNSPFTIAMDFKTEEQGVLFSSARPQGALEEEDYGNYHSLALFVHDGEEVGAGVSYDNFYVEASRALDSPIDGEWHTVVTTFSPADVNLHVTYLDGFAGEEAEFDPDIPQAQLDTPLIGDSLNTLYPAELGVEAFAGEIDNVRIFNSALSAEEALYLFTGNTDPYYFGLGAENIYDEESVDSEVVNLKDYAELMNSWLEECFLGQ